jgi:hypothetical protein
MDSDRVTMGRLKKVFTAGDMLSNLRRDILQTWLEEITQKQDAPYHLKVFECKVSVHAFPNGLVLVSAIKQGPCTGLQLVLTYVICRGDDQDVVRRVPGILLALGCRAS